MKVENLEKAVQLKAKKDKLEQALNKLSEIRDRGKITIELEGIVTGGIVKGAERAKFDLNIDFAREVLDQVRTQALKGLREIDNEIKEL